MARRTFNAMISLPIDLEPLWSSLNNKSVFVVEHLREMSGAAVKTSHKHYPSGDSDRLVMGMCNPHLGVCPVCIQSFEFGQGQATRTWHDRLAIMQTSIMVDDGTGAFKTTTPSEYISEQRSEGVAFDPAWFDFSWSPVGDEEE